MELTPELKAYFGDKAGLAQEAIDLANYRAMKRDREKNAKAFDPAEDEAWERLSPRAKKAAVAKSSIGERFMAGVEAGVAETGAKVAHTLTRPLPGAPPEWAENLKERSREFGSKADKAGLAGGVGKFTGESIALAPGMGAVGTGAKALHRAAKAKKLGAVEKLSKARSAQRKADKNLKVAEETLESADNFAASGEKLPAFLGASTLDDALKGAVAADATAKAAARATAQAGAEYARRKSLERGAGLLASRPAQGALQGAGAAALLSEEGQTGRDALVGGLLGGGLGYVQRGTDRLLHEGLGRMDENARKLQRIIKKELPNEDVFIPVQMATDQSTGSSIARGLHAVANWNPVAVLRQRGEAEKLAKQTMEALSRREFGDIARGGRVSPTAMDRKMAYLRRTGDFQKTADDLTEATMKAAAKEGADYAPTDEQQLLRLIGTPDKEGQYLGSNMLNKSKKIAADRKKAIAERIAADKAEIVKLRERQKTLNDAAETAQKVANTSIDRKLVSQNDIGQEAILRSTQLADEAADLGEQAKMLEMGLKPSTDELTDTFASRGPLYDEASAIQGTLGRSASSRFSLSRPTPYRRVVSREATALANNSRRFQNFLMGNTERQRKWQAAVRNGDFQAMRTILHGFRVNAAAQMTAEEDTAIRDLEAKLRGEPDA